MTIDITEQFQHKKAFVDSIEIQIKRALIQLTDQRANIAGDVKYLPVVEIESRRGNVYRLEDLTFIT